NQEPTNLFHKTHLPNLCSRYLLGAFLFRMIRNKRKILPPAPAVPEFPEKGTADLGNSERGNAGRARIGQPEGMKVVFS
ncbi:MAG TPA: hypothetical protein PLU64_10535, partial [Saprospiraceae bacterium]|nr:hypothetical protein [Saprospiraceae bacterium]